MVLHLGGGEQRETVRVEDKLCVLGLYDDWLCRGVRKP